MENDKNIHIVINRIQSSCGSEGRTISPKEPFWKIMVSIMLSINHHDTITAIPRSTILYFTAEWFVFSVIIHSPVKGKLTRPQNPLSTLRCLKSTSTDALSNYYTDETGNVNKSLNTPSIYQPSPNFSIKQDKTFLCIDHPRILTLMYCTPH